MPSETSFSRWWAATLGLDILSVRWISRTPTCESERRRCQYTRRVLPLSSDSIFSRSGAGFGSGMGFIG